MCIASAGVVVELCASQMENSVAIALEFDMCLLLLSILASSIIDGWLVGIGISLRMDPINAVIS